MTPISTRPPASPDSADFVHETAGFSVLPCRDTIPVITHDSIGPVRLGQTYDALREACPTVPVEFYLDEGDDAPAPAVGVRLGAARFLVLLSDTGAAGVVQLIASSSPGVRTVEGVGVGSLFDSLALAYGPPRFFSLGCGLQAWLAGLPHYTLELRVPSDTSLGCGNPDHDVAPIGTLVHSVWLRRPAGAVAPSP